VEIAQESGATMFRHRSNPPKKTKTQTRGEQNSTSILKKDRSKKGGLGERRKQLKVTGD